MLLSKRLVLGVRYGCFGLFIVLNAIICTVGVYNLTLANSLDLHPIVDGYLVFLGALALIWIIPIIFVDIHSKDAFLCRTWIESTWVGFFWLAELVGAAAFTATVPQMLCRGTFNNAACQSTRALEACLWLCMAVLFIYFTVLVASAAAHERLTLNVWQTSVRHFPWFSADPRIEYPDPAPPYRQRPSSQPVLAQPQPRQMNIPRFRLTVTSTIRDTLGRSSGRTPPPQEPNLAIPLPVATASPQPQRQSRRSFLSFSRSRRSSRRPSSRRPYDPEAFYPDHLQAALRAIVYENPQPHAEGSNGPRSAWRPVASGPEMVSISRRRPPVPPVPSLPRPLPHPEPAISAAGPSRHSPPSSRPQLTIDTSGRRRSRPLPQLHTVAIPAPPPIRAPSPVYVPRYPDHLRSEPTPTDASISPLGDWPRANVLSLPLRPRKRPPPPPSAFATAIVPEEPSSRRGSGSSDDAALSSASGHMAIPISASPRGSSTVRPSHPPRGPRSRQASLTSLNSMQLSNLISQTHGNGRDAIP